MATILPCIYFLFFFPSAAAPVSSLLIETPCRKFTDTIIHSTERNHEEWAMFTVREKFVSTFVKLRLREIKFQTVGEVIVSSKILFAVFDFHSEKFFPIFLCIWWQWLEDDSSFKNISKMYHSFGNIFYIRSFIFEKIAFENSSQLPAIKCK